MSRTPSSSNTRGLEHTRFKLTPQRIAAVLKTIREASLHVKPARAVSVIDVDEPDNRFLECASAAGANYLVTGNTKHFPRAFKGTVIVTPRQFMDLLLPKIVYGVT